MLSPVLTKAFNAGGTIPANRICKHGTADGVAVTAAAATDALLGVSTGIPATTGERVDLVVTGIADVEYGGNVSRGALLTSDAEGRAVVASPAAGANARVIGQAWVSGVLGDIGSVLLAPGSVQG